MNVMDRRRMMFRISINSRSPLSIFVTILIYNKKDDIVGLAGPIQDHQWRSGQIRFFSIQPILFIVFGIPCCYSLTRQLEYPRRKEKKKINEV